MAQPGWGERLESATQLLATSTPVAFLEQAWGDVRIRITAYVGEAALPDEIPARVRCLVTDGADVLAVWDPEGRPDCLPGGGAEPDETIEQAVCREVFEESGCRLAPASIRTIGWVHLETLSPHDPDSPFPYPDSFMPVVHAVVEDRAPAGWIDTEGYVVRSAFLPFDEVVALMDGSPVHAPYLDWLDATLRA